MEERIEHSDVLNGITVDVFQRTLELSPQLREFVTLAKQYHKALLGASVAANSFYQGFTKIVHFALEARGSNKLLGKGICDIIAVHKQIENQASNVVKALSQDFIVPLEEWIENETSQTKAKQKNYIQDNKIAVELVEKSKSDLVKVRKKSQRSKTSDKYEMKEQQIMTAHEEYQTKLDELRVSGCHEALTAQRNAFSFIVEKMSSVSKKDVVHHEKAYSLLHSRLPIWENLVKQPLSLELNVSSLLKQITQSGSYDKSLDEHLKSSFPGPSTVSTGQNKKLDKRLSHQFAVGPGLSAKQNGQSSDKETKVKLQAIFQHNAADSTQLSFEEGDIIKTLTSVTSGWQYGENTRTEKSGWFPVSFTEKVLGVLTSTNPTHTMPSSGHVHPRPPVLPAVNGCQDNSKHQNEPHIPVRDYGVPLKSIDAKGRCHYHVRKTICPSFCLSIFHPVTH